ncbi:MAG: PKD domain-containing protein [bacterium]|nr:PKD domain-containing protein [bacterium]
MPFLKWSAAIAILTLVASCAGRSAGDISAGTHPAAEGLSLLAFPADTLLPGETLDMQGFVSRRRTDDEAYEAARRASGINADSEFVPGVQRFEQAGDVSNLDEASEVHSGAAGSGALSAAIYRLTLGGVQPGALSADINLHLRSDGALSSYWIAVADYTHDRWDMRGPFAEAQTRQSLDSASDYLSPLGNCFIAVIAFDGAWVDVVGVGASSRNGDVLAPPAPAALGATPVAGAVFLEWTPVIAADLAGYQVYYSLSPFTAIGQAGVRTVGYLEGGTRQILPLPRLAWMAVAAVDIDGNESALSDVVIAAPLPGSSPVLELTTDVVSGDTGVSATLAASGADSYDFDVDGDGNFEITGNLSGTATVATDQPGIIRPAVRGVSGPAGTAVALGSVSLIVGASAPPVAVLTASDIALVLGEFGSVGVDFSGSTSYDPDGGTLTYAIDPQGDGTYVNLGAVATSSAAYLNSGVYLAKLRVTDSDGKTGYDSVAITVRRFASTRVDPGTGVDPSITMIGGRPAVAWYDFDKLQYIRATDAEGRQWASPVIVDNPASKVGRYASLVEVTGLPAISYYDETVDDLYYVLAVDPLGDAWNPPVLVDSGGVAAVGEYACMVIVNGTPGIAYHDSTNDRLKFARSSSANGYPAATWSNLNVSFNTGLGIAASMAIISGNPAVSYLDTSSGNRLGYVRSDSADGSSWGFPITINDPVNSDQDGTSNSLADVAGHPAIALKTFDGADGDVWYVRATSPTGENASDWPSYVPAAANAEDYGTSVSLAIVGGRPAVAFYDGTNDAIRYVRATTITGNSAAAWPASVSVDSLNVGLSCDLVDANGLPLIAFYAGPLDVAVPELQ